MQEIKEELPVLEERLKKSSKEKPLICPKCKSARWDKEPKKKK